jgi:hypothetical protein
MQSKPAEDLCVVESGETMTHTSPRLRESPSAKEKDYTYFWIPQAPPESFHYFSQPSETLKRPLAKKSLMYIKKNRSPSS